MRNFIPVYAKGDIYLNKNVLYYYEKAIGNSEYGSLYDNNYKLFITDIPMRYFITLSDYRNLLIKEILE